MHIRLLESKTSSGSANFLFHSEDFVFHQSGSIMAEWVDGSDWIRIPFRPDGDTLCSLGASSFGGFDHSGLAPDHLAGFMQQLITLPQLRNYKKIQVRSYPECYDPENFRKQHLALQSCGFTPQYTDLNIHLDLASNSFRDQLHRSEFRYLNKAKTEGWQFRKIDFTENLTTAYAILVAARTIKGYPMTMKEADLARMFASFPEEYLLFGVFDGDLMIAASVSIRINDRILYDFYHGDLPAYRKRSPVVFLIKGLYDFARSNEMKLLDLGTCSEQGILNPDLCSFKKSLGGKETVKITYERVGK